MANPDPPAGEIGLSQPQDRANVDAVLTAAAIPPHGAVDQMAEKLPTEEISPTVGHRESSKGEEDKSAQGDFKMQGVNEDTGLVQCSARVVNATPITSQNAAEHVDGAPPSQQGSSGKSEHDQPEQADKEMAGAGEGSSEVSEDLEMPELGASPPEADEGSAPKGSISGEAL